MAPMLQRPHAFLSSCGMFSIRSISWKRFLSFSEVWQRLQSTAVSSSSLFSTTTLGRCVSRSRAGMTDIPEVSPPGNRGFATPEGSHVLRGLQALIQALLESRRTSGHHNSCVTWGLTSHGEKLHARAGLLLAHSGCLLRLKETRHREVLLSLLGEERVQVMETPRV